jgi:dihydrodipicolinate synthase/N-acetylneuraminate lyase
MNLLVPVVTLADDGGRVDEDATHRYAVEFRRWAADARALLCGSTGLGDTLAPAARGRVFEVWGEHLPADRLVCCAWDIDEARRLAGQGRQVLLAGSAVADPARLTEVVRGVPGDLLLYSHPRFGWVVSPQVLGALRDRGALPRGVKLSKASPAVVRACRAAGGGGLALWDGSARNVRASLAAGADGVAAACLAAMPPTAHPTDVVELQRLVDSWLVPLDAITDRRARIGWLTERVRDRLHGRT